MFNSRKELLAYLAGFLDGEGSFIIMLGSNGVFSARVNAGQVDLRPLELLKQTFGGWIKNVTTRPYASRFSNTVIHQWTITGRKMYEMLLEIQPYLVVKASQADCLIQLQESVFKYKGKVGKNRAYPLLPKEERARRMVIYERCKALKRPWLAATTKREGTSIMTLCDSLDCNDDKIAEVPEMSTRFSKGAL